MRAWEINIPKPPDDVWGIEVDFANRLNRAAGEELYAASVTAYKLWGYHAVVEEYNLTGAARLNVEVEAPGHGATRRYSYPVTGQPSAQLRLPTQYNAAQEFTIVPPESIVIGPSEGENKNTRVSFDIRGGEDDTWYAVHVLADTTQGRVHSCVIRFRVRAIGLTE